MKGGNVRTKAVSFLISFLVIVATLIATSLPAIAQDWVNCGMPSTIGGDRVYSLAWDGANGRLYAGCLDGNVYKNQDPWGSGTWSALTNPDPSGVAATVTSLAWDGTNGRLYAGRAEERRDRKQGTVKCRTRRSPTH
jgi:hypothetical protein